VIPKKFDHWRNSIKHPKGFEYKYYAERDDFAVAPSGSHQAISTNSGTVRDWWKGIEPLSSSLSISTALRYKIGAPPLQCGDGTEWPKSATLNGNLTVGMTPNYGMSASINGVTLNAIDPCKISVNDTDVLQEVKNQLTERVRGGLSNVVARMNTLTARSQVEDVWHTLRNPIQLEPDAWLLLNIGKVWHSGFFSGGGDLINDTIHITAKPVLVFGAEPSSAGGALPQLETEPASTGFHGAADAQLYGTLPRTLANRLAPTEFHVVADIPLDYPSLSQSLATRLKGKQVAAKGDFIVITDAAILGRGGNQVVVRIAFGGDAIGHLYFVGKPEMNTLTQSVQIGGLRLDYDSEQLLQKSGPDWLYSSLRELIVGEASLGVTPAIDRMRDLVTKALNRSVSQSLSLQGTVASVQGIGVFADVNSLYVRVMSDGSLNLKVAGKP
jgi:hypothetical protein